MWLFLGSDGRPIKEKTDFVVYCVNNPEVWCSGDKCPAIRFFVSVTSNKAGVAVGSFINKNIGYCGLASKPEYPPSAQVGSEDKDAI